MGNPGESPVGKKLAIHKSDAVDQALLDRQALARSPLLANADLEALEGLLDACAVQELNAGDVLIQPGERNQIFYFLLSGRLRVHLESPRDESLCLIEPGESVGELSVIDQKPTSAYVVADVHSRLLKMDQEIFWAMVNASHAVAANMLVLLANRLRNNNSTVMESLRLQQVYKRHATMDELTGLHNRRWADNILKRQMTRSSMNQTPLSILMIDVDYFKRYNDKFGHLAGDHVLYAVSQTMLNSVRPTDMVARYGGEEFVVVLPDTDIHGAKLVAERIRKNVAEAVMMMSDESILPSVTVSVGVAQMKPLANFLGFLTAADSALYRAKAGGRNAVAE